VARYLAILESEEPFTPTRVLLPEIKVRVHIGIPEQVEIFRGNLLNRASIWREKSITLNFSKEIFTLWGIPR
jgi:hypothetical protein